MQIAESDLTFHVIFMPGTVGLLRLFTLSLLQHSSSCRFRLVANGCNEREKSLFRSFCQGRDRVDWMALEAERPLTHGAVLTLLQRRETSPYFAFMDSDIFATAPYIGALLSGSVSADAIFSGAPFWAKEMRQVAGPQDMVLSGVFNRLEDGTCVGSSYLAIYDNRKLQACIAETGIDFRLYYWRHVARELQRELQSSGKVKALYDTGKLLNILLSHRGHALHYKDCAPLVHIGGVSLAVPARKGESVLNKLRQRAPLWMLSVTRSLRMGRKVRVQETRSEHQRLALRVRASEYCLSVLSSMVNRDAEGRPAPPADLAGLDGSLRTLERQVAFSLVADELPRHGKPGFI